MTCTNGNSTLFRRYARSTRSVARRLIDYLSIAIVLGALLYVSIELAMRVFSDRNAVLDRSTFVALTEGGRWIGPRTAPVVLVVYSDYTCGFCREFHETLHTLRRRYSQHVAIVIKHFVEPARLRHYSVPVAAECAGDQGRFAQYDAAAFANSSILEYNDAWFTLGELIDLPDLDAFSRCVQSGRHTATVVQQYEEATGMDIAATPTFFINGIRTIGATPFDELDALVAMQFRGRNP